MCLSSRALSRELQVTVRFTFHCRTLSPQYGTWFMSPLWRLDFVGGAYILENF